MLGERIDVTPVQAEYVADVYAGRVPYPAIQIHNLAFDELPPAVKGVPHAEARHRAPSACAHAVIGRAARGRPDAEVPRHVDGGTFPLAQKLLVQDKRGVADAVLAADAVGREGAVGTEIVHHNGRGETHVVAVAKPVTHLEDKPIVQIPLRTLIKGILGRVPGTIFIPRVLVGVDVVDDGRQLALGDCAGRGPHALNNDLPDARDRLFRFVSQRGNAQQRQAEQYPGDAQILHAPISSCFAMNTQRRTEAMQSVLRMAAASSNFTAREPLFSE